VLIDNIHCDNHTGISLLLAATCPLFCYGDVIIWLSLNILLLNHCYGVDW
jgi:hypothetical protein